jgi:Protein of unknown function (DUF3306)
MTEGVLRRWSRRKLEAAARAEPARPDAAAAPQDEAPDLPPIETLGTDSDYVAFLASGVPEELRRRALRVVWATDPKIVAFRGFADYDWDCNAPGYGALLPIDDVARLCDSILRQPEPTQAVAADENSPHEHAERADAPSEEPPCTTA